MCFFVGGCVMCQTQPATDKAEQIKKLKNKMVMKGKNPNK